jgi:hypothetical protein
MKPFPVTIIVFQAHDGRFTYCPIQVRHDRAFNWNGQFDTEAQAIEKATADRTIPKGARIIAEAA